MKPFEARPAAVKKFLRRGGSARSEGDILALRRQSRHVLGADMATSFGAQSAWRQLTDLIGRRRAAPIQGDRAIADDSRAGTDANSRGERAQASPLPIRPRSSVRLFAEDEPSVAAPVIAVARLTGAEWGMMLHDLPTTSRSLLRHRRDLPAETVRALNSFRAVGLRFTAAGERAGADHGNHR